MKERIPKAWVDYIFLKRRKIIEKMIRGEAEAKDIYLEFTRTLPAIVTYGPAGLNASIKMIGLLPKKEILGEILSKMKSFIKKKPKMKEVVKFLLDSVYVEDILDLTKLFTLDLALKNTWKNINETKSAVLIFFTPPSVSYMVKAEVTIHRDDDVFMFANYMHDLFHVVPIKGKVISRSPTYLFHIEEIWDKSADKFGIKIYP
ncbi:MAG: hypothetical protein Q6363_002520 [Candidatus Njordarchaeota archaeon]